MGFMWANPHPTTRTLSDAHACKSSAHNQQMPRAGSREPAQESKQLFTDIQLANQIQVSLRIMLANVVQKRPSLAHHSQQTASARIVSHCSTHVQSHSVDSFRQHRNLNIGRTIVAVMSAELADNLLFSFFCNGHVKGNSHLLATTASGFSRRPRFLLLEQEC